MIRVAVLGAAHQHVSYLRDEIAGRDDVTLVAVAEPDAELLARFLPDLGAVPIYAGAAELLAQEQPDAVFLGGRYSDRAADALTSLRAGCHVLSDKPLCTSLAELDEIAAAADAAGKHVSIAFEKRFRPETIAATDLLRRGELGALALVASTGPHRLNAAQRPDWFLRSETYGGVTADLTVHDIDLVLALSGAVEGTVAALSGRARDVEGADIADHTAVLLRAGAVSATIEAHWLSPEASPFHGRYRMRLTGAEGTAEIDWAQGTVTVETHRAPLRAVPLGAGGTPTGYFFDALRAGVEPAIGTAESLRAMRVALLAGDSARQEGSPRRFG